MLRIKTTLNHREIRRLLEQEVIDEMNITADHLLEALRAATPVDTGKAQASWRVVKEPDGDFTLSNTQDYIRQLNAGSSQQAPTNFIERVVLAFGKPNGVVVTYK